MTRESYQQQLDALRTDVVTMGELVVERLRTAVDCLDGGDPTPARAVAAGDGAVNERYLAVERQCIDLYALQQPVAGDLRVVTASFKISTDFERIGDLAATLAGHAAEADFAVFPGVDLAAIGDSVVEMVERAIAAYEAADAGAPAAIAEYDQKVDRLCTEASEAVVQSLLDREVTAGTDTEALLADVSRLLVTIRDLERAADHAVNVAARTLYMVDNDDRLIY